MTRPSRPFPTAFRIAAALFLSAGLLAGPVGSWAEEAGLQIAQLPKEFDDYTPPSKSEQLPPEGGQGGGSTGGGSTGGGTTGGGKLTYRHILGKWCSASSNYVIARSQLTVILTRGGTPSSYRVVDFDFTPTTVVVHWITADNRRVNTTFGRFSSDGKQMVQVAVNRVYRRCDAPAPLGYQHILGSWCDANSKYIIARNQLVVVFSGGRRVSYKVTDFKFEKDVVEMHWVNSDGKPSRTRFGRYSDDRRSMTQLVVNRVYRRC